MEEIVSQIKSGITINVDVNVKDIMYVKNLYQEYFCIQIKSGKYLASIIDYSKITRDETIKQETKIYTTNFNDKNYELQLHH